MMKTITIKEILRKISLSIKVLILKRIDRLLVDEMYFTYHGEDFYFILWDLDQYLRSQIKYNSDKLSSGKIAALQLARDKIYELMENYKVDFNHVE